MNDLNRDRAIIDLDELERQLREAGSARRADAPAPQEDPLAELARIVEQDDPYRQVWSRAARDGRAEPAAEQDDDPFAMPPAQPRLAVQPELPDDPFASDEATVAGPAFGELRGGAHPRPLLAEAARHESEYRQADSEPEFAAEGALPPHPVAYSDAVEPQRGNGRRIVAIAAAVVVLAVGGGAAALMMRGHSPLTVASGEAPVIAAETGPSKIQPENPGGVEVPNQDRQIYERTTEQPAPVRVVGNTEQPVDVAQAPKAEPGQSIIPAPASATPASTATTPKAATDPALHKGAGESVLAALAPRRVKTVSVRPDGTIIDPHAPSPAAPAANQVASLADAVPSGIPAATASTEPAQALAEPQEASGATPAPPPKPRVQAVPTTTATPVKQATVDPAAPATPAKPKPAQRVAAVDPAEAKPAPSAAAPAAPSGSFSVQLAAPASEQEARDTASRLAKRFSGELGGLKPAIRQAEVNGKSIWRVRVGAMSRDEATALCVKIQGAGGQCFVARN